MNPEARALRRKGMRAALDGREFLAEIYMDEAELVALAEPVAAPLVTPESDSGKGRPVPSRAPVRTPESVIAAVLAETL